MRWWIRCDFSTNSIPFPFPGCASWKSVAAKSGTDAAHVFPIPGPAAEELNQQLRADLLDLTILWAELHVFLASDGDVQQARYEALAMLAEAESELGAALY